METPIALHSVAHRVSHQIPAESEMSRQNRATPPPNQGVAPFSGPPRGTFLSFAAGRGPRGVSRRAGGIAALLGSENGSRYRGVSQLQSHQSRYSIQLRSQYHLHGNDYQSESGDVFFAFSFLIQEPLTTPFLNGLLSREFSRGKTAH